MQTRCAELVAAEFCPLAFFSLITIAIKEKNRYGETSRR